MIRLRTFSILSSYPRCLKKSAIDSFHFVPLSLSSSIPLSFRNSYSFAYRSEQAYINFNKDYYELLGLTQQASQQQIKQKFYLLAKEYHPDKKGGDQAYFKQLNQAYNVLSQPNLKQEYDSNRSHSQTKGQQSESTAPPKSASIDYQMYSQLSREGWSYYRRGTMEHSRTDYSNYVRIHDPEKRAELDLKEQQQWDRAIRGITKEQFKEESDFREKLVRKYVEDIKKRRQEKKQHLEKQFNRIAEKVEKYLGKRARALFDSWVAK